jgi:hypothetical protein
MSQILPTIVLTLPAKSLLVRFKIVTRSLIQSRSDAGDRKARRFTGSVGTFRI